MAYLIVWRYRVVPAGTARFEAAYRSDGDWAQLFARADGFLGVRLLRDADNSGRYLTIDRWTEQAAFDSFQASFGDSYRDLDRELSGLSVEQERIGAFTSP